MSDTDKLWFSIGSVVNLALFSVRNFLSWSSSYSEFIARKIKFDHEGYSWGFPFDMYEKSTGYPSNHVGFTPGVIFNALALIAASAITGMLLVYLAEKISALRKGESQ